MDDSKTPILTIAAFVLLIVAAILFSKPGVSWRETYDYKSKQPYGTAFVHELLQTKYSESKFEVFDKSFANESLNLNSNVKYDYVKIDNQRYYDKEEVDSLLHFVQSGNNAFVSLNQSHAILDTLFNEACKEWKKFTYFDSEEEIFTEDDDVLQTESIDSFSFSKLDSLKFVNDLDRGYWKKNYHSTFFDSLVLLNFEAVEFCRDDSTYAFYHFQKLDTFNTLWTIYNQDCLLSLKDITFNILSKTINDDITYIEIPFGKGRFYFQSLPKVFTNVELLSEDRLRYVEKALSYLDGEQMIWDAFRGNSNISSGGFNYIDGDSSPLSYILSKSVLRWAIYLSLVGCILFVVFRAKRRQQYIPVIKPNINTSIDYVEMMGQLYFEDSDHHYIANEMWKKFLDYIRVHYFVSPKEEDETWIKRVAAKSTVNEKKLIGILRAYEKTKFENISEEVLVNFYHKLSYFYKNAK